MLNNKVTFYFIIIFLILFYVITYAQDGQLDMSYAGTGEVINSIGSTAGMGWSGEAHSILIQSDGKIIAAGYTTENYLHVFALVRYNEDGSRDNIFVVQMEL